MKSIQADAAVKRRKGIVLAGGAGTRLHPLTLAYSKQLMPVYDKPMIYYPISTLMLAGVTEILIITTSEDQPLFERLLGDGGHWGVQLSYAVQDRPDGIAEALIIGEAFLAGAPSVLILGDNLFYGHGLQRLLREANERREGSTVFAYWVKDPERYGILRFGAAGKVAEIVEKPASPPSNYAVTGIYFFDGRAPEIASTLRPSVRGELEITDVINHYLTLGELDVRSFGRGMAWLDTGTHESLLDSANYIQVLEARQGLKIMVPEEVAWHMGFITDDQLRDRAEVLRNSGYGDYLISLLERRT